MADDVKQALAEAQQLLAEIQNGTKAILNDPPKKKSSTSSYRPEKKTSSWAKSSTPRTKLPTAPTYSKEEIVDTPKTVSTMARSSAGYTISKASRLSSGPAPATDVPYYDANIDSVSTRKRPISALIMGSGTKMESSREKGETVCSMPDEHHDVAPKTDGGTGFSFGKSQRRTDLSDKRPTEGPVSILDVSRGERMLWEKPQAAVSFGKLKEKREFEKEPKLAATGVSSRTGSDSADNSTNGSLGRSASSGRSRSSSTNRRAEEMLSNKKTTPAVSIAPEHKTKPLRRLDTSPGDYGTPGPGSYADSVAHTYSIASGTRGPKFTPGPSLAAKKAKRIINSSGHANARAPGPGYYEVDAADTAVRQKVAGFSNIFKPDSDTKVTPQLQRKRYFEEKARDMREEHDDRKDASDSLVKKRAPSVQMRPDMSKGITYKNREIIRKIRAEKAKEAAVGYYDKNYEAVEVGARAPVRMEKEVQAVNKTKAMLDKAGIMPASSRRALDDAARDKFLGPQLPVPWGEDRLPPRKAWHDDDVDDDGNESPTEEVMALLKRRTNGGEGEGDGGVDVSKRKKEGDTTEAYLRSSYSGALTKSALNMRVPTKHDARKITDRELTVEERNRDFLPTQVHKDWATDADSATAHRALEMKSAPGREVVKVLSKGVVDRVLFNEGIRRNTSDMGPGVYETMEMFGAKVKGGVVDFESFVAREDAVGPRGERPEAALSNWEMEEEGVYFNEEVIVDAVSAKKKLLKREPAAQFSDRDRFEKEKEPEEGLTHLGGEWFEGMAEEVSKKQPKVVNYDTMVGRRQDEEDDLDDMGSLVDGGRDGDVVQVDVANWKPHKERVVSAPEWTDPKRDPRFIPEKERTETDIEPNYEYLKPRQGVGVIDFKLQKERWEGGQQEEDAVAEELGEVGYAEDAAARRDAADLDHALEQGDGKQSKKKREPMFVDMNKQPKKSDHGAKSEAPDVDYDVKEGVTGKEARRDKGVLDWNAQLGRDAKLITKEKVPDDMYSDDEEVIMDINADAKSNVKRTITAPAWNVDKAPKTLVPKEPLGNQLAYNVETEFGVEKGKGGVGMGLQGGRHDDPSLQEVGLSEADEELDIQPDYELLKSGKGDGAARGGVPWKKTSGVRERNGEKQGPDEDPPEGQVLDLDPRVPDWKVSGKEKNTGFGGKANEDVTRRGAKDAMRELELENEELDLKPVRAKDKSKNTLPAWKKESDAAYDGNDGDALKEYMEDEVLDLAPKDTAGKHPNTMPSWNKQTTKGNDRPDLAGIDVDNEELILSPHEPQADNRRTAATSWVKQVDPVDAKLSLLDDVEELKLDPKKPTEKKAKSGVPWNKQRDTAFDADAELDGEVEEELILSPKEIRGDKGKTAPSWKNQAEREYIGPSDIPLDNRSEELILSPKEVRTTRGKSALSWNKQSDAAYDTNKSIDKEIEELILSPKFKATRRDEGGAAPAWKNESSRVLGDANKVHYQPSEELKLSPKDHRKIPPKSTLQWSREADTHDYAMGSLELEKEELYLSPKDKRESGGKKVTQWNREADTHDYAMGSLELEKEELYLSPKDKRGPGGKSVSVMNSKSHARGGTGLSLQKTEKHETADKTKNAGKSSRKGASKLSVSFGDGKEEATRGGSSVSSSRASRAKSTSDSSTTQKKKSSAENPKERNAGAGVAVSNRSRSTSTEKRRGASSSQKTSSASAKRSARGGTKSSTTAGGGAKNTHQFSSAQTPPRVQAPSPYAAAPVGFSAADGGRGSNRRASEDVMASLDRKIEQLELYD